MNNKIEDENEDKYEIININETTPLVEEKLEQCRYCWESPKENSFVFLKPCKCTNPICSRCLKKRIELNKVIVCEICLQKFQIPTNMDIRIPKQKTKISIPTVDPPYLLTLNQDITLPNYIRDEDSDSDNTIVQYCCGLNNNAKLLLLIVIIILLLFFILLVSHFN